MFNQSFEYFNHKVNSIIAFVSGDIFTTLFSVYYLSDIAWLHPIFKLIMAALVGIIGGFSGLLGKDLYTLFAEWYKNRKKNENV